MARYAHADLLDKGIEHLKNTATKVLLLNTYTAGQSYATVLGNALCTVTISSADFGTIAGADAADRTIAFNGKSGNASGNSSSPDLHIAFTDGSAKVLLVTDETTNQAITINNAVTFPSISPLYTSKQPTAS